MIGAGTTFARSDDGIIYDTNLANIVELDFPTETKSTSEISFLDSVDNYKEFEAGMIDAGEVSLTLKWDVSAAGQVALRGDFEAKNAFFYQITMPDGTEYTFKGVVTEWGKSLPKEETITQSVKIKITGSITETIV